MTLLWCAFGALALAQAALASFYDQIGVLGEQVSIFTKIGIAVTGLYLCLHRRRSCSFSPISAPREA